MEEKGVKYLYEIPDGSTFKLSRVQFYYEGPYDFDATFRKVSEAKTLVKAERIEEAGSGRQPYLFTFPDDTQAYLV